MSPYPRERHLYAQVDFHTRETVCERFQTGTSPTWDRERRESAALGLPMPYYRPDVVDPDRRAEILADRRAFLRRHADDGKPSFWTCSTIRTGPYRW